MLKNIKNNNGERYLLSVYDFTNGRKYYDGNYIYQTVLQKQEKYGFNLYKDDLYFKGLEKIYGVAQSKKLLEYIKEFCEENKQYPNVFTKISAFYIFRILKKIMIGSNKWVDTQLFKCDSFKEGNRMSPLVKNSNPYETRFAQEMDDERNIHIRDVRIFFQ